MENSIAASQARMRAGAAGVVAVLWLAACTPDVEMGDAKVSSGAPTQPLVTQPLVSDRPPTRVEPTRSSSTAPATSETTKTTGAAEVRRSLTSMLRMVPDSEKYRMPVLFRDYAKMRDILEIERPSPDDPQAVDAYLEEVRNDDRFRLAPGGFGFSGATVERMERSAREFGYSALDTGQDLFVGGNVNPTHLAAVSISPAEIRESIEADANWAPRLREVRHGGFEYLAWNDDPLEIDLERSSPIRLLGRGGTLALIEEVAVRTVDPSDMELILDTVAGMHLNLMDSPDYAAAAEELERRDVYSAEFTSASSLRPRAFSSIQDLETARRLGRFPLLPSVDLVGTGHSVEPDGSVLVTIVYVTGSADDAGWVAEVASARFEAGVTGAGSLREVLTRENLAILVIERDFSPDAYAAWFLWRYLLYEWE